jgi:cofilin
MSSGVNISKDIPLVIKDIQIGSKYKYIIFKISDDYTEVVVDKTAPKDSCYDDFVADLKLAEDSKQCRWGVVDIQYKTRSGMDKNKLVYFTWNPDTAPVKQKMVYAASNDAMKKAIGNAVGVSVQATDASDLDIKEVEAKIQSLDKA